MPFITSTLQRKQAQNLALVQKDNADCAKAV